MALTWRNVNAPNYGGAVAAQRTGANLLSNIGSNTRDFLKSNEIRNRLMEDRTIAAEQRDFDRASDLLSREQTQQAIDKSQFGLDTQKQAFTTAEAVKQAQIDSANQRMRTSAYELGQTKKIQEDTDKGSQAILERFGNIPSDMSERQVQAGISNFAAANNLSPQAVDTMFAQAKSRFSPTSGEAAISAVQVAQQKQENKLFENQSKAAAKEGRILNLDGSTTKMFSPKGESGGFGTALTEAELSDLQGTDLDEWFSVEFDSDSRDLARNYTLPYQKALGKDLAPLVKKAKKAKSTGGYYFDSVEFDKLVKKELQNRLKY